MDAPVTLTAGAVAATDGGFSLIAQIDTHHPQATYIELSAARTTYTHTAANAAPKASRTPRGSSMRTPRTVYCATSRQPGQPTPRP